MSLNDLLEEPCLVPGRTLEEHGGTFHFEGECCSELPLHVQVINLYQMTAEMWEERITACYAEHRGRTR